MCDEAALTEISRCDAGGDGDGGEGGGDGGDGGVSYAPATFSAALTLLSITPVVLTDFRRSSLVLVSLDSRCKMFLVCLVISIS